MTKYFGFMLVFLSANLCAQENLMFDTTKIDGRTRLIGRYPQYDKQKVYRDLNFIIEDPAAIKAVIKMLSLGAEGRNEMEDPEFRIALVQGHKEVKSWIVSPALKSAMYNGHTYAFDPNVVKVLAAKFPFDYKFDKIPFQTKDEYENYLNIQKQNSSFLFDYAPSFKYEGAFEIQFPRNQQFSSPKVITEYLTPILEQIAAKGEYRVIYVLNEKNKADQNQFTMTIKGSKKLFDGLQLDNLKRKNWQPTIEEGWFFYRMK